MFAFFWRKIKDFFITRSRLARFSIVILVLFITIGIFGLVSPVSAEGVGDWLADGVSSLLLMLASFIGKLLVLVIGVLLEIVSYNDFTNSAAVEKGWIVLRDLCNLFFILILLVIAFGTILKLETYKYNKLLGRLVIMIVLVNFSRMIAGFFIDISQVVLMTFANAFSAAAAANFTAGFQLKEMLGLGDNPSSSGISPTELISLSLLPVILLTVALFTMIAMVAVFLVRILMLWILVILSPIAYLLAVLPTTQQYSKQWWSNFIKWVTTGPILAFFIWFGLTLISGGDMVKLENTGDQLVTSNASNIAVNVSNVSDSQSLLSFVMAIGMFIVSLITAQSLGGMAGGMAGKALGKLQGMGSGVLKLATAPALLAGKGVKMGAKAGAKSLGKKADIGLMKFQKKMGVKSPVSLRPSVIKEGWQGWQKQRDNEQYAEARGHMQDVFHKYASSQKTDHGRRALRRREAEEESNITAENSDEIVSQLKTDLRDGNKEAIVGKLRKLSKNGDFDNVLDEFKYRTEYTGNDNDKDVWGFYRDVLGKAGFSEQEQIRVMDDVGRISEKNGQYGLGSRVASYDSEKDEYTRLSGEEAAAVMAGQADKLEAQMAWRLLHRTGAKAEQGVDVEMEKVDDLDENGNIQKDKDGKVKTKWQHKLDSEGNLMIAETENEDELRDALKEGRIKHLRVDTGFHDAGKQIVKNLDVKNANRGQANAVYSLMNHPEQFKQINEPAYNAIWEKYASLSENDRAKQKDNAFFQAEVDTDKDSKTYGQIKKVKGNDNRPDVFRGDLAPELKKLSTDFQKKIKIETEMAGMGNSDEDANTYFNEKYRGIPRPDNYITSVQAEQQKEQTEETKEMDQKQSSIDQKRNEVKDLDNDIKNIRSKSPMADGSLGESDEKTIKEKTEKITEIEKTIAKEETELTTLKSKTVKEEVETRENSSSRTKESTRTTADSHGAVDDAQYNIDNVTSQLKGMPELNISKNSLEEFGKLIDQLADNVDASGGIDANSFDMHIKTIGDKLSKTLDEAKVKSKDKEQVMGNYKQASDKLQIGTVSEKTLQIRIINSLNNLSNILKSK